MHTQVSDTRCEELRAMVKAQVEAQRMVHPWGTRDGFRKDRHLRLALKDKQEYEKLDRGRYSKEKRQDKPRQRGLTASSLLGHIGEQFASNTTQGEWACNAKEAGKVTDNLLLKLTKGL